jgi:hypothetical protein
VDHGQPPGDGVRYGCPHAGRRSPALTGRLRDDGHLDLKAHDAGDVDVESLVLAPLTTTDPKLPPVTDEGELGLGLRVGVATQPDDGVCVGFWPMVMLMVDTLASPEAGDQLRKPHSDRPAVL